VNTGEAVPIDTDADGAKLANVALDSWQTRVFLTPRASLADAPAEWLTVQRSWWKGTVDPGPAIADYHAKLVSNLTDDWAFKPVEGDVSGPVPEDLADVNPKLDDSTWKRMSLGIFDIPDYPAIHHGFFRKTFTIPTAWTHGKVSLSAGLETMGGGQREYLDGTPIDMHTVNEKFGSTFTPGSVHQMVIEIWNANPPVGTTVPIFLSYRPDFLSEQPINESWSFAPDYLRYDSPKPLPLTSPIIGAFRTVIKIDAAQANHNVIIHSVTDNGHQHFIVFNGRYVACNGNSDANLTPWVKFGQDNELVIVCDSTTFQQASLQFYEKEIFP
jgi:hypothetical protein